MWAADAIAKKNIPLSKDEDVKKGDKITITKGNSEKYILWHSKYLYTLPAEYVDEDSIKVISGKSTQEEK